MLRISPFLSAADATPATARALLEERPAVARYLAAMSRSNRTRARGRLLAAGYSAESVGVLLPKSPPAAAAPSGSLWDVAPSRVRIAVADALDRDADALSEDPTDWDTDAVAAAVSAVAALPVSRQRVAEHLGRLQTVLRGLGVLAGDIARAVDDLARLREAASAATATAATAGEPLPPLPEPYRTLDELRARLADWVETPAQALPTAQTVADLCVVIAAAAQEPGAALALGERGGVPRYLAERLAATAGDGSPVYPLAAALGFKLVRDSFAKWRAVAPRLRIAALKGLPPLLSGWGVTRPQLAAIGLRLSAA